VYDTYSVGNTQDTKINYDALKEAKLNSTKSTPPFLFQLAFVYMSTWVSSKYNRFSFMDIVTAVGSILSLLNWASNYILTEVTDFSIDKSMVKKLYSKNKNPLKKQ
jgi:hypothetical protein